MTGPQRRAIASCAASNEPRAASRAASFARVWECRPAGSDRDGVGGKVIGRSRLPPGAPGHRHRAEQRGQQPAVPGLQPGPGDPVSTLHRAGMFPGLLFFPYFPQVEVILQQLAHHLPAPLVQELLQLAGREPGRGRAGARRPARRTCLWTRRTDHRAGLWHTLP